MTNLQNGLPPFPWPPERALDDYSPERAGAIRQAAATVQMVVFDFDGVFTDNAVYLTQDGLETIRASRWEGFGLDRVRALGIAMLVLSTEKNPVVSMRCKKMKLPCVQNVPDKAEKLRELAAEHGITMERVAYVGNDTNDEACLRAVSFPITVADAHPAVAGLGLYRTRRPGGYGAVREICDLLADLRGG